MRSRRIRCRWGCLRGGCFRRLYTGVIGVFGRVSREEEFCRIGGWGCQRRGFWRRRGIWLCRGGGRGGRVGFGDVAGRLDLLSLI